MKIASGLVPGVVGMVFGAGAAMIIGFSFGGWTLQHNALTMAENEASTQVIAAMLPICLEQAKMDPNSVARLAELKETRAFERDEMLVKTGWATMPGTTGTNRLLVSACLAELAPKT